MKKSVSVLGIVLVLTLFLSSCGSQSTNPSDTAAALKQIQTGTQGIVITPLANFPPPTLFDQNELVAILDVQNKGSHTLQPQECFVQINGFDTNIVTGGFDLPQSCAQGISQLEGKSLYNLQGGSNQLEFHSPNVILPEGVYEYNPKLNVVTCYNYHTTASPAVCIDPKVYQITPEQKACDYRKSVGVGGGQGAPVAVTGVNVEMVGGAGGLSRAIFEITVANQGIGRVLSPYTDLRSCTDPNLQYTDVDKVGYSVRLSGGGLVDCKPGDGFVRLNNKQGKIICSFSIPQATAYETPLLIDLDYNYLQNQQMPLRIIKTPQ